MEKTGDFDDDDKVNGSADVPVLRGLLEEVEVEEEAMVGPLREAWPVPSSRVSGPAVTLEADCDRRASVVVPDVPFRMFIRLSEAAVLEELGLGLAALVVLMRGEGRSSRNFFFKWRTRLVDLKVAGKGRS